MTRMVYVGRDRVPLVLAQQAAEKQISVWAWRIADRRLTDPISEEFFLSFDLGRHIRTHLFNISLPRKATP